MPDAPPRTAPVGAQPGRAAGPWRDFMRAPLAAAAAAVLLLCLLGAAFAPWLSPQDPHDLAALDLNDSRLPPAWLDGGSPRYPLGTDDQGRDILSALMHGGRISFFIGASAVALSLLLGVSLGLAAGLAGGWFDALVMRLCDVMLSFPAILVALMVDGVGRALFPQAHTGLAFSVLIAAIALTGWVPYTRVVRAATLVERGKDYVHAARLTGVPPARIARRHVLPNVLGPVWVLASVQVATAILLEATLSFLGVGVPPTSPSLGSLIRVGGDFLFSGEWWILVFPALALVLVSLSVNIVGDWWRDRLDMPTA